MVKILLAFNNDRGTILHDFFESSSDEVKQICVENGAEYTSIVPPNLNEEEVVSSMVTHQLCVIIAHGNADGVTNEKDEDVVSTRTTNYNFSGKGFYSIVCYCGQNLCPHLLSIGTSLFVGYNDKFLVRGEHTPFIKAAVAGLQSFISGDSAGIAYEKMLLEFDKQIEILDQIDPIGASMLLHNKESLVFSADESLTFNDLV